MPILVGAAATGGPTVQQACIAALGELGGEDARHALAAMLERGAPSLAGAAAQALAAIGDREAVTILVEAAQDGFAARRAALGVLARATGPEVEAMMLGLIENGAPVEQRVAAGYFAQHPTPAALAVGPSAAARCRHWRRTPTRATSHCSSGCAGTATPRSGSSRCRDWPRSVRARRWTR